MSEVLIGVLTGSVCTVIFAGIEIYQMETEIKSLKKKLELKVWLGEREIGGNTK